MKRAACLLLFLPWSLSCSEQEALTQIMVVVDSDYDGFTRVEIEVEGFEEPATVEIDDLDKRPLPRRLALLHSGGPLGPIDVTVRAYVDGIPEPVLREPRAGLKFEQGETRMLKVDLLWECVARCPQACLAGADCVSAAAAAKLAPWDSKFDRLPVEHTIESGDLVKKKDSGDVVTTSSDGAVGGDADLPNAGSGGNMSGGTGGPDSGPDGGPLPIDAGPPEPMPLFGYKPTNFDPGAIGSPAEARPAVVLDCPVPEFDSTTLTFTNWCGAEPIAGVVQQDDGSDAALLVMSTFSLSGDSQLRLTGDKPVILAVFGDARINGTIDASAKGRVPGPGADRVCASAQGSTGASGSGDGATGAGGGSGGGFGSAAGRGGAGGGETLRVDGGTVGGNSSLTPLRGGCSGGRGGGGTAEGGSGGGGGGAVQISASGELVLLGAISAGGGGGQMGSGASDGGGGGGSGGAILIEGELVLIDSAAVVAANGGGGAGGQPSSRASADSTAGADGSASTTAATGGDGSNSGGSGGVGAFGVTGAADGEDGMTALDLAGGGGGGGGGTGRIRLNQAGSCMPRGVFSPPPSVDCPSCKDVCPVPLPMEDGCLPRMRGSQVYYLCPELLTYANGRSRCTDMGLDLVRIDDASENAWLGAQLATTQVWIGASDFTQEGEWVWIDNDDVFWNGTASAGFAAGGAFNDWAIGEPNASGDCARRENDGWHDQSCTALTAASFCE